MPDKSNQHPNGEGDFFIFGEKYECPHQHHKVGHTEHCCSGGGGCSSAGEAVPQYLENNIVRFIYLLRREGLRVGSSELLDALRALEFVPLEERDKVRLALKATLVKKSEEVELFDRLFDHFFTTAEEREVFQQQRQQKLREQEQSIREADEVLTFRGEQLELSPMEKTVFAHMPRQEKERLSDFVQMNEGRDTLQSEYRPFLEGLVKNRLRFWYKQLRSEIDEQKPAQELGDEELSAISDAAAGAGRGGKQLLTEDMQNIARRDLPQATAIIRRMARLLVTRISRRYRSTRKKKVPEFRSTIRHSIQYGGVPFHLKYKSRRLKKPRLLLLCDVSGSMIHYTSFVLQFIYGLNTVVQGIESFIFSEDLERITSYFNRGEDFEGTIKTMIRESGQWGGGTSLHKALETLLVKHPEELTRNTIVILVSDTRTIRHRDALEKVKLLGERVKEVIWLNTLPREEWDSYTTVAAFRQEVTMFPCNTLADLEQVLSRKLAV